MKTAIALCALLALCTVGFAQAPTRQASDRQKVQLTIYNDNFALVREQRAIELSRGVNFVRVEDIAARIDPTSISFLSLTAPESVVVREQEYQYDLLTTENILNKSVGKRVRLRRATPQGVEIIEGVLLTPSTVTTPPNRPEYGYYGSQTRMSLALKTDRGIILNPQGEWTLDELPAGLLAKPTLLWKLDTTKSGKHEGRISYLTEQIGWKSDYVAVANAADDKVDLNGWVTITNGSGTRYPDATLQLMAGDVRRVREPEYTDRAVTSYFGGRPEAPKPSFEEKAFFDYHLYTLQDTTTIEDNSTKQLTLLSAAGVPVKKLYVFDPDRTAWGSWQPGSGYSTRQGKINMMLELENSKKNNMGMPLPKGKMRIYKADDKGRLQFVGEDQIDHTPKDEKFRLWVGDAFDIVGEKKETEHRQIATCVWEYEYEINLRNHKETAVSISVVEHIGCDWEVLSKTHDYKKKDAHTIEFPIEVPKDGNVTITYRVRMTCC